MVDNELNTDLLGVGLYYNTDEHTLDVQKGGKCQLFETNTVTNLIQFTNSIVRVTNLIES